MRSFTMLHFEVQKKRGRRSDYAPTVKQPSIFPSFVLVFNDDWNDYTYRTWFSLFFFDEGRTITYIGDVKLMKRGESNTYDAIEKSFDGPLGDGYCSVGFDPSYYSNIYSQFKNTVIIDQLLTALCDCTYTPSIYENFVEDDCFKQSLMREDSSEQAFKEAAFLLSGKDKEAAYSFTLHFSPDYLNGAYTDWTVKLLYDAPPFMRMVGLIGNNGVGKTQMLKRLVASMVAEVEEPISLPLFRSCLVISSTPFDGYDIISAENTRIPFRYFTFNQNAEYTETDILSCIETIYKRPLMYTKSMIKLYKEAIDHLLGEEVGNFLKKDEINDTYSLDKEFLHEQVSILSSGQLHLFSLLSFIYAHIHLASLLVIDEPEVHMHPQIIVSFMAMLGKILHNFRSYAVIATHSPLVVREIVGQNVYLMQKLDGGIPTVAKVAFETFGADASELYMRIFQYDETMSSFFNYVKGIGREHTYNEAMRYILKFVPNLSLNARLSIRDYLEEERDA